MWLYQSICQAQNNSQSTVIHCTPARMATGLIKNFTEYTSRQTFELNQPMIVLGEFTTVYSKLFNSQKKTLTKQNLIWPSHCLASIRKIFLLLISYSTCHCWLFWDFSRKKVPLKEKQKKFNIIIIKSLPRHWSRNQTL